MRYSFPFVGALSSSLILSISFAISKAISLNSCTRLLSEKAVIIIEDSGGDCSVCIFISAGGLVSGHGGETALCSVHRRELCCRTSVPPCKASRTPESA